MSHVPRDRDVDYLNRHILRWQPETVVNLPEGVGFLPFLVPGSPSLVAANIEALRRYQIVICSASGVVQPYF